ncbi:MAG: hypothetical protein LBQ18_05265 [Campylobacteraceae bacterium]|nr:hypothetical protein [Campylobacteraceae bacterium]
MKPSINVLMLIGMVAMVELGLKWLSGVELLAQNHLQEADGQIAIDIYGLVGADIMDIIFSEFLESGLKHQPGTSIYLEVDDYDIW